MFRRPFFRYMSNSENLIWFLKKLTFIQLTMGPFQWHAEFADFAEFTCIFHSSGHKSVQNLQNILQKMTYCASKSFLYFLHFLYQKTYFLLIRQPKNSPSCRTHSNGTCMAPFLNVFAENAKFCIIIL